tara:strand:+ start:2421 stop:2708 length:288 start_codon:yes stop_codon:yes gene_type:complete
MSKKATQSDFEEFAREVAEAMNIVGIDLLKIQRLLYALMEATGNMEYRACPSCGENLLIPDLPTIEKSEICPKCEANIHQSTQTTFEDWDSGEEE